MTKKVNGQEIRQNSRGQLTLSAQTNTTLTDVDTYYPILGTFTDGDSRDFSLNADGTLTYTGLCEKAFLLTGVSDLSVSGVTTTTYGLHLNGVLVPGAETPHSFTAASKTETIAITSIVTLSPGDYINAKAKSSAAGITLTVSNLKITVWGEC